jgi:PAS domain S-box-containing protein
MKTEKGKQYDFEIRNTVQQNELELFKKILDSVPEGFVIANSGTGMLRYANYSFCNLFDYSPTELSQIHFSQLHPKEFLTKAKVDFHKANPNSNSYVNVPCLKKDGSLFYVEIYDRKILFQDEECNLATFVDVTSRYKIEQTLKESEEKIKVTTRETKDANERASVRDEIFNQFLMHSPALIYFKDENVRTIKLSKNFEDLLGIPVEQMIGKTNYDLFPSDFAKKMVEDDLKILKDNKTIEVEEEFNNRYYTTVKFPVQLNKENRFLAGFSIDITERKIIENRQRFFGKVLEILNKASKINVLTSKLVKEIKSFTNFDAVGIRLESEDDYPYYSSEGFSYDFLKDEKFVCSKLNNGKNKTDSNGKPVLECSCGLVISGKVDKDKPNVTKKGTLWTNYSRDIIGIPPAEDLRVNPRNTCIHYGYMSLLLIPIKVRERTIGLLQLNDKKPYRLTPEFISFFEEIASTLGIAYSRIVNESKSKSAKEKAEESELQLQQLNSTKDKLFSVIAHDLKNPFNTILGYSKLLKENFKKYEPEKVEKYLESINSSAQGTLTLLENLLDWAKAQTGQLVFNPSNLSLKLILNEIVAIQKPSAAIKNISLNYFLPNELVVYADKEMLLAILRNMVSNAIKFTNFGGKIGIYGIEIQNNIEITISDNGIGISTENKQKLFNSDSNITTIGTAKEKGTGLGLVLCKEFVEKHGGRIWVESEPGKGSDFKFTLPMAK